MAMDGLNLAASAAECRRIAGGRVDKIQQPEKDELVLLLRCGGENLRLLISASPEHCRMQLTGLKKENPIDAPAFCMLLRKRLTGGRIAYVEQPKLDRVVNIGIETQNDLGDNVTYVLSAEIMGKYSNIILVNEQGTIVDAIKRIGIGMSNVRTILPGQRYEMPPAQDKKDPTEATAEDFYAVLSGSERGDKALSAAFFGLSPKMAAKLLQSAGKSPGEYLAAFYAGLKAGEISPCIELNDAGEPLGVLPFIPAEGEYRPMPSMAEALDCFYAETDKLQSMRRHGASIRKLLQNNIDRCEKKLALYNDAIASEGDIERLKLFGELLIANAYRITSGSSEAAVQNYYNDPPNTVIIPIEERYSVNDNAQRYYKKYQKAKAARDMAAQQREKALEELAYLEGQMDNLDKCTGESELRELTDELTAEGYIKRQRDGKRGQKLPPSKPMCFVSSDGTEIYVGKNNRQNDALTLKFAAPHDIWLHTKDIPGSHVIIRSENPSKETLYQGALLAAYYSKGRGSENVPVDYTERRFVKKPSGAKPGMVIYTTNKTAYVTPEPSGVKAMQQKQ